MSFIDRKCEDGGTDLISHNLAQGLFVYDCLSGLKQIVYVNLMKYSAYLYWFGMVMAFSLILSDYIHEIPPKSGRVGGEIDNDYQNRMNPVERLH